MSKTLKEYAVYHKNMRDAQIYTDRGDNEDMTYDSAGWRDFTGDPLIDIASAEDEYKAVDIVAEKEGIHKSNLYAEQHIASMADDNTGLRLEAAAYKTDEEIGAEIKIHTAGAVSESIQVSCSRDGSKVKALGKYILNWNDEYLNMIIVTGPVSDEMARDILHERIVTRLVELNAVDNREEAEEMYQEALKELNDPMAGDLPFADTLSLSQYGASIRYGGGYEDRYEIVEHKQKLYTTIR